MPTNSIREFQLLGIPSVPFNYYFYIYEYEDNAVLPGLQGRKPHIDSQKLR